MTLFPCYSSYLSSNICVKVLTISPTVGFNIKTLVWGSYKLNIWDIGGQKILRGYWRNYFECTDAIVWTVDLTDCMRVKECSEALKMLLKEDRLLGTSLLILGNKCEVESRMNIEELRKLNNEKIESLELEDIKSHSYNIFEVSGLLGTKLYEAFKWLIEDIEKKKYGRG
ncbi:hypothetical protein T552_00154 [Pneumocystis carinii B80]|uniref:ADP-ribosylation factor-like protein 2 n=1 Tax=Pneumocystis carinii (strain B80) TaxID=1408658 RepID=A0A0W4ZT15_PNEC8|nr:hypothetical protein T552_00154 [Pneumocystis carinii B80]KTW31512.1 hypothetical protein T552_00154 [Pneumocystis carinii B80]